MKFKEEYIPFFVVLGFLFVPSLLRGTASSGASSVNNISFLGDMSLTKGMRNNNPGNIRINVNNRWLGKIPVSENTDGEFEQFEAYIYGVRAMIVLIRDTYMGKYSLLTIREIVTRYAPNSENNTTAYIEYVVARVPWAADTTLGQDFDTMSKLIPAMISLESGSNAIWPDMFRSAWRIS